MASACESSRQLTALREPVTLPSGLTVPAGTHFQAFTTAELISEYSRTPASNSAVANYAPGVGMRPALLPGGNPQVSLVSNAPLALSTHSSMTDITNTSSLGQTDEDSLLMRPNEIQGMEDFFQSALNDTLVDNLFNPSEQEFLSNFLDGFLDEQPTQSPFALPKPPSFPPFPAMHPIHAQQQQQQISVPQQNHLVATAKTQQIPRAVPPRPKPEFREPEPVALVPYLAPEVVPQLATKTVPIPVLAPRKQRHKSKELLTEQEKRLNHIASEQKRRQNIKLGFEALSKLIPSVRNASENHANLPPSKTAILAQAIDYLAHLERRNQKLRERARLLHDAASAASGSQQ